MNEATKPRRKWVGKTLLIICSLLFILTIISIIASDELELLNEMDEVKAELSKTKQDLNQSDRELIQAKQELTQAKEELKETNQALVNALQENRIVEPEPASEPIRQDWEGVGNIPDFTYKVGYQIGLVVGLSNAGDQYKAAATLFCKETTVSILKEETKKYLQETPDGENDRILYFAGYLSSTFNAQTILNNVSIDCDISTPLSEVYDSWLESQE
ncbi:MAG: hypothetical protein F4W92_08410 [Gammaproteobacteria bacterium]|nr:hypothetical protein [Gammaproteobacteria bacterium]